MRVHIGEMAGGAWGVWSLGLGGKCIASGKTREEAVANARALAAALLTAARRSDRRAEQRARGAA